MSTKFNLPTEVLELPSKGLLYPTGSALAKGEIEMKHMTAKEEDILTNPNYIAQGVVIDKLLESLIVTKGIDFNEILIGDKNALMIGARILAYGKDYDITYAGNKHTIDLTTLDPKPINEADYPNRENKFKFTLPVSGNVIEFKLLTHADEKFVSNEIAGLKKRDKDAAPEVTTRLRAMILSINGSTDKGDINEYVNGYLLAKDARALREEYARVQPDIDLTVKLDGVEEGVQMPVGLDFFWPNQGV